LDLIAEEEENRADTKRREMEAQMEKARKEPANPLDPYASDDEEQVRQVDVTLS
jgi:hypothetical protein